MKRFPFSFFHSWAVCKIAILAALLHAFLSTQEIPLVSVEFHSLIRPAPCCGAQSSPSPALPKKSWRLLLGKVKMGDSAPTPGARLGLAWTRRCAQSWELALQPSGRAQQLGKAVSCGERSCKEQVLAASWGTRPNHLHRRPGRAPVDTSKGNGCGLGALLWSGSCKIEKGNVAKHFLVSTASFSQEFWNLYWYVNTTIIMKLNLTKN